MQFAWSEVKNAVLKRERGVCFEDVAIAVEGGHLLNDTPHPDRAKYPHQRMLAVEIDGYVCIVPYVRDGDICFLKTVYPSRKAQRIDLGEVCK